MVICYLRLTGEGCGDGDNDIDNDIDNDRDNDSDGNYVCLDSYGNWN